MPRYIDLSGWIYNDMWQSTSNYPGATITDIPQPPEEVGGTRVYNQQFVLSGQSGTYIETQAHVDPTATPVSDCPIEDFVMNCVILRLVEKGQNEPIFADELKHVAADIPPDSAVLLATGWAKHWQDAQLFIDGSPYVTADAARWLIEQRIRLLGADIPRFDYPSQPVFPWQDFWACVPYLMAPVVNIFSDTFTQGRLFCFPLKIWRAMGTPVRAVLEVDD
jgi:kynurenine formamidase